MLLALWRYLIRVDSKEIFSLPNRVDSVDDVHGPSEARALVGFWLNKGMTAPCRTPSKWMRDGIRPNSQWGTAIRARIARQVECIRHWQVINDYSCARDVEATWFIDPPYQGRLGRRYRANRIDYPALADWCRSRRGQVIVCENVGADWLPFRPFLVAKGTEGKRRTGRSVEAIWTQDGHETVASATAAPATLARPGPSRTRTVHKLLFLLTDRTSRMDNRRGGRS